LAAVAFDTQLGFERRLRALPRQPITVEANPHPESEPEPSNWEIELWELHSELALVCPRVPRCARELLPDRDPQAFLTLWRLADTARTAFLALATVVVLTLLAQLLH